jgi:hypothetical protein
LSKNKGGLKTVKVVPINEAEAIIEPFWDPNLSELEEYKVTVDHTAKGFVKQTWCSIEVYIEKALPGKTAISMERQCDIYLDGYNVIRVFASIPKWAQITLKVRIDGVYRTVINNARGGGTVDEFDGYVYGRHMTGIQMEFALTETQPACIQIFWLGLANSIMQKRMEKYKSPYTPDWPKMLRSSPGRLEPEIGIFFDDKEIYLLRQKVRNGYLKRTFNKLRLQAIKDMTINPEAEIGRFIPLGDRRWCRNRDMKRTCTAEIMERLAFVGLIDENPEMLKMAARMALSAAHCEYWCESFMGVFPGSTWHHRSFTEARYSKACAIVLDWAGSYLTPYGKEVIQDAIIMKGLPRIESDFKRMEYIREMNQGALFSLGRIIGLLSLLPSYPRYKSLLEDAEQDLREIIDRYVQDDGGTLEGMAYWNATFSSALQAFYALARYHNMAFEEYANTIPKLIKTSEYALSMLSITKNGTTYLPINDAKSDQPLDLGLVAAFCRITNEPEWKNLYALIMQADDFEPNIFQLIIAPSEIPVKYPIKTAIKPKFAVFPVTGQVSSIREDPTLGYVHFHLCSGPTCPYHYHEDKGSFILEVNDETLAIDRGVTSYDHPETSLISMANRHNLLCPKDSNGVFLRQPHYTLGGRITSALEVDNAIFLCSDNTNAWNNGLFRENIRRIFSPAPDLFFIDDVVELNNPSAMVFLLNSLYPIVKEKGRFRVYGKKALLDIFPVDWVPHEEKVATYGIDCHLRPVNVLQLETEVAKSHNLLTVAQITSTYHPKSSWQFKKNGARITAIKGQHEVSLSREDSDLVIVVKKENRILRARCQGNMWKIEK